MKMVWGTQKIFGDDEILVNATAVRVPVFYGHRKPLISKLVSLSMQKTFCFYCVMPKEWYCLSQMMISNGCKRWCWYRSVLCWRIRKDISHSHGINLWVVSDNIQGRSLNSANCRDLSERLLLSTRLHLCPLKKPAVSRYFLFYNCEQ